MDKKLKAKWVRELRSGKYKQCEKYLADGDGGYCCLGILQKIATGAEPPRRWSSTMKSGPEAIPEALEFLAETRVGRDKTTLEVKLANMNDTGKTFKQIAAYIERYL